MVLTDNAPNLRNIHILVLDDHQDTLEVFRTALESCMANVLTARTARDAVTILKTVRLDAIISDLAMPGEDGLWVVDQLRRLALSKVGSIPALAVTAHWDRYTSKDDKDAGFDAFLLQLPHRVPRPVAALDLPATRGARQRLVARAPGSPSSDRRCPLPFAWTHQHDGTPVSAKATSYRLGGRGRPPPFFSRSAPALASWTLTFPCSGKGDAPQARVTRLGGGSVCGMQKS